MVQNGILHVRWQTWKWEVQSAKQELKVKCGKRTVESEEWEVKSGKWKVKVNDEFRYHELKRAKSEK